MKNLDSINDIICHGTKKTELGFLAICSSTGYQVDAVIHFSKIYKTRAIASNRAKKAALSLKNHVKTTKKNEKMAQLNYFISNLDDAYYDVDAIEFDAENNNFDIENGDIGEYSYATIISNSLINGQLVQAKRQYNNCSLSIYDISEIVGEKLALNLIS